LPAGVRTIAPAGEALSRALVDRLYAQPGVDRVLNCFGPTECTVYCASQEVSRVERAEPAIGSPVAGAQLSVRDPDTGRPVTAAGAAGELWVAGPVLARGYLRRPELTGQRFVTGPDGQRWYRTGDLVRYDGTAYHFLGRRDDQVKVRGHRVELGELQAVLAAHPQVQHAVVLAPADGHGSRQLVGYVEPVSTPPAEAELRAWLRDRLPGYLLPAQLVVLDRLPLGPTGKVDRAALPAPGAAAGGAVPFLAPRTATEALVAEAVAEALGLPEVGVHDRFTDLGGHSLAAAGVVARLAGRLGHAVPLGWFLAEPTVAALAGRLDEAATAATAAADAVTAAAAAEGAGTAGAGIAGPVRHPGQQVFPLTDLQQEFWLARQVHPDASTTIAVRLRLSGRTGVEAVRGALAELVRRHEVLRTGFEEWDDGPVAVVRPPGPVPVTEVDAGGAEAAAAAADAAARHVFDLAGDAPLIRATLIRTRTQPPRPPQRQPESAPPQPPPPPEAPEAAAELVVAVDHAAFDGYSVGLLMTGLAEALAGRPVVEPVVQVGDLARYERTLTEDPARRSDLRAYWRRQLAGLVPASELTGRRGQRRAAVGERIVRPLDPELVRSLDATVRECGVSRFAGYAAALAAVLHRLTGEPAAVIGTGAAVRDRPGLEQLIGPLVRVLPIAVPTAGDPTFRELAGRAAAAATGALVHQDLPAPELTRCAGFDRPAGAGLCPVILTMAPEGMPVVAEAGPVRVELAGELATGMAVTDLAFFVNQTATGTEIQVEYDVGLYEEPEVVSLLQLWLRALREAAADPDRPISTVELADPDHRQVLLRWGRGGELPQPRPATVVEAIAAQAAARPHAVAVVGNDGELSYAQLVEVSQRLAGALLGAGAARGDRVGVCVPRDQLLPAALLGVVWAGAAYVPLDAEHPVQRLALLATDCQARFVVSRGSALPAARSIPGVTVVDLDQLPPPGEPPPPPAPADIAYVLYTSGSTGRPKGVEVTHANLADHTTAVRAIPGMDHTDSVLAVAPLSFDLVGAEIWSPLAAGARCVVVQRDRVLDGQALADRIAEVKATVAVLPPTLLRVLRSAGWTGDAALRVWCAGEALDPALVRQIAPHVAEIWNAYGPTETTTLSTAYRVTGEVAGTIVPIGRPLPGEWAYVMDRHGRLAPSGVVGELWIGGAGVARGYQGRPELTEAVFVPDPYVAGSRCYRTGDLARWSADGQLEFLGRADHQVKLRGQRIELDEIEAVLHEHPDVTQAVVTVYGSGPDATLVGYLVPETVDSAEVTRFLRRRLPDYLVPSRWVRLAGMPTTTSGKADRRALPAPGPGADAGEPPSSELERFVAEVWREVLGATGPGRRSDFFALGGNSFAATRVTARLRAALACDIPVGLLLERPVLAEFAAGLEQLALDQLALDQPG
jgi:amino acid adenylation domain-containing protein